MPNFGKPKGVAVDSLSLDLPVTVTIGARRLGVSPATVKGWIARGRVHSVMNHPRLGHLYRLRDLVDLEEQTADSPNRRSRTRTRDGAPIPAGV